MVKRKIRRLIGGIIKLAALIGAGVFVGRKMDIIKTAVRDRKIPKRAIWHKR